MGEITDTCRPGEAHPSPVRQNAGFEYSLAIVALYPAVIPSFHLLPLINNWRYWLPLFPTAVQDPLQIDWYPGLTQHSLSIPRPLTGLRDWHKSSLHISETSETEHDFSLTLPKDESSTWNIHRANRYGAKADQSRTPGLPRPQEDFTVCTHTEILLHFLSQVPTRCRAGDQCNITPGGPKQWVQNLHTKHTDLLETQQKLHTNYVVLTDWPQDNKRQWSSSCHFYISNTGGLIKT